MAGAINMGLSGAQTLVQLNQVGQSAAAQLNDDQRNIQLSEYAAQDSLNRGATAASLARMEGSKAVAQQNVAYANSGVDSSTGTAAQVQSSTDAMSEYNSMMIRNNARREAWGHDQTTAQLRRQKDVNIGKANSAIDSTILGGLASAAKAGGGQ